MLTNSRDIVRRLGKQLPRPRILTELKTDPEIADDIKNYMVALVELPARAHAAE
jgi:hypothetical protein